MRPLVQLSCLLVLVMIVGSGLFVAAPLARAVRDSGHQPHGLHGPAPPVSRVNGWNRGRATAEGNGKREGMPGPDPPHHH